MHNLLDAAVDDDSKKIIIKYINYGVDFESYEILQVIKEIQLLNEESIISILGKKNKDNEKTNIEEIISRYEKDVSNYKNLLKKAESYIFWVNEQGEWFGKETEL